MAQHDLWQLPECIWQGVLSQLLGQCDIGRLDSACCKAEVRKTLVTILASTCLARASSGAMPAAYYTWSLLRGLTMQRIVLPSELASSPGMCKSLLKVNGTDVMELQIEGASTGADLINVVAKHCRSLIRLFLIGQVVDEFALKGLLENGKLICICFTGGQITGQGDALAPLPMLSQFLYLKLRHVAFQEQLFLRLLSKCPNLEGLHVYETESFTPYGLVTAVRATPRAKAYMFPAIPNICSKVYRVIAERGATLTNLALTDCRVDDVDVLVILGRCRALKGLSLLGCTLLTSTTVYNIGRYCRLMEDVVLDEIDMDDAALVYLIKKCPKLWGLSLPKCAGVTDRGIEYVGLHCKALTHLVLYYNPPAVTAQTFALFGGLTEFTADGYL
jgi:hypothetical protein